MKSSDLPADFGKMPANYDFSHKGLKWDEYKNDFQLRTDAVWEKQQLKDWFRLYMRCFYYDKTAGGYQMIEPEDLYTVVFESWAIEDLFTRYTGFNPTGRTNCFQIGQAPRQKVHVPHSTYQTQEDYFTLCALRFERWMQCDIGYHFEEGQDKSDYIKTIKDYPCYGLYYETTWACSDDSFDFLMEIHYARKANQTFEYNIYSHEMKNFPTIYDSPKNAERIKKTY